MAFIAEELIIDPQEYDEVRAVLTFINSKNKKNFWKAKRFFDIIAASFAILVFSIPMLIIALVIFISDGHSPIFKQVRVGRYGEEFLMYKFRTMVPNADRLKDSLMAQNEMDGPVFKIADDPRITKVGKFLRKTSLDELPQFFNVLLGNMTLIGPRPPLPREVKEYAEFHKIRLLVTPGITCIWQTTPDRNSISFDDWVRMDIDYVMNRTVWMDIKIVFRTIYVMVCGEGE